MTFSTGDAVAVPRERDTITSESVLKSEQVGSALGSVRRSFLVGVVIQGSLVFFGVLVLLRASWSRFFSKMFSHEP